MNLNEILTTKKIVSSEFPADILKDYIYILEALTIKLERLANNKNLSSALRVNYAEDSDMIKSVINDLKRFN